ncbi:hypothetical protein ACTUQ0_15480, partial [Listeria monocytogenes]|uniref:hypothetical protein n=1 Tax=Listeria monocytogenes TaxID=1639 RepID=UPI003FA48499
PAGEPVAREKHVRLRQEVHDRVEEEIPGQNPGQLREYRGDENPLRFQGIKMRIGKHEIVIVNGPNLNFYVFTALFL